MATPGQVMHGGHLITLFSARVLALGRAFGWDVLLEAGKEKSGKNKMPKVFE